MIGYILVYFMLGKLPWQDVKVDKPWQRREAVSKIMTSTSITNLCKGLPKQFHLYLSYCRGLKFEEKPNYSYLRSLFQDLLKNTNNNCDKILSWNINFMPQLVLENWQNATQPFGSKLGH